MSNIDMATIIEGVTLSTTTSVRKDKYMAKENAKKIIIKVIYDGATLEDVFQKDLAKRVIAASNDQLRPVWDALEDGMTHIVRVADDLPKGRKVDPLMLIKAELAALPEGEAKEAKKAELRAALGL